MPIYEYKGFTVSYDIEQVSDTLCKADGWVVCDLDSHKTSTKFHTEYPTYDGVRVEIKKLVENYIDFEWMSSALMAK